MNKAKLRSSGLISFLSPPRSRLSFLSWREIHDVKKESRLVKAAFRFKQMNFRAA
jgi:hypothetical protein